MEASLSFPPARFGLVILGAAAGVRHVAARVCRHLVDVLVEGDLLDGAVHLDAGGAPEPLLHDARRLPAPQEELGPPDEARVEVHPRQEQLGGGVVLQHGATPVGITGVDLLQYCNLLLKENELVRTCARFINQRSTCLLQHILSVRLKGVKARHLVA